MRLHFTISITVPDLSALYSCEAVGTVPLSEYEDGRMQASLRTAQGACVRLARPDHARLLQQSAAAAPLPWKLGVI